MGKIYSVTFEETAATAAQDLFQIIPSGVYAVVHAIYIGQSSDAGDSESEMLNVLAHYGTTNGSGGSTKTPTALNLLDGASAVVAECNNTSQSTEGSHIHSMTFNVLSGLEFIWPPQLRPVVGPSDIFIVELQTAPTDSITLSGTLYFEESRRQPKPYDHIR